MKHNRIGLHGDRVSFGGGHLRGRGWRRLFCDRVGADAGAMRLADGAAGGHVNLPPVPRAAQDLALARPDILPRLRWYDCPLMLLG